MRWAVLWFGSDGNLKVDSCYSEATAEYLLKGLRDMGYRAQKFSLDGLISSHNRKD